VGESLRPSLTGSERTASAGSPSEMSWALHPWGFAFRCLPVRGPSITKSVMFVKIHHA
jgi:hypothetical protein